MASGNMTRYMDADRPRRFRVVEVEGWPIRSPHPTHGHAPLLSVSILDSAYGYAEIARFNQEDLPWRGMTVAAKHEALRNRAHGYAAMLEAQYVGHE